MRKQAAGVLRVLADLSPSSEQRVGGLTVPLEWFRWLPVSASSLFARLSEDPSYTGIHIEPRYGERLAAVDQIRPLQHSLRGTRWGGTWSTSA